MAAIVAGVILMVIFDAMPQISSLWLSILIIALLGVIFAMWSVCDQINTHRAGGKNNVFYPFPRIDVNSIDWWYNVGTSIVARDSRNTTRRHT